MSLINALYNKPLYADISIVLQQLDALHPLSDACKKDLAENSFQLSLSKGQYLVKTGDYCKHIYFIIKGIFSGRAEEKGQTMTTFISVQGEFMSAIEGLYGFSACTEDIKAEENALLLALHVDDLFRYFNIYPEMNIVMRKVLESHYKKAHHRSIFFRVGTAYDKYVYFLSAYAEFANRIPLYVIASFINVKLNTLQKVMKQNDGGHPVKQLSECDIVLHMNKEQPFLQKKLTINQLAEKLKTTPHQLSYLLNTYFKQNFNHFVNSYRIKYVLDKLTVKKSIKQYSLDGLGSESGFSSRSSFFSEFKKCTGVTPSTYLKTNGK